MRSSLDYAGFAQLCGRSPIMREIMRAHNRIIPRSLEVSALRAFLSSRHSSALYCFYCIVSVLGYGGCASRGGARARAPGWSINDFCLMVFSVFVNTTM